MQKTAALHYRLTDYQGNNTMMLTPEGLVEDTVRYYPYGEPIRYPVRGGHRLTAARHLYADKEYEGAGDIREHNFGARRLSTSLPRWTTPDPLCEKYYSISPYAYCAADPINQVDPTGCFTMATQNNNGTFNVIGGELDEDLNIYLYMMDEEGNYTIRGPSIGQTLCNTSFYDSDNGEWAVGATINPEDYSGLDFIQSIQLSTPSIYHYIDNAGNGELYDFKERNLPSGLDKNEEELYQYRGMPIFPGIYASGRDIGNYAAGYVAGMNNVPWKWARKGFDYYQNKNLELTEFYKWRPEGVSSQNAQKQGWEDSYLQDNKNFVRLIPGLLFHVIIKK